MVDETVLVVEDDTKTIDLIGLYLCRAGYRILVANDGVEGLRQARDAHPDIVILDVTLPGLNGFEVCRMMRMESDVPVIILTARSTEDDKLAGFALGADDYVTKPFNPREIVARTRAILRRRVKR